MKFMEAVKAMKEGKKVRRKKWGVGIAIHPHNDVFCYYKCNDGSSSGNSISDVEATDWEIYEEQDTWNLADKELYDGLGKSLKRFSKEDFKMFIQKVKEDILKECRSYTKDAHIEINAVKVQSILDKRAGDL